jgi:hypothetical protein
MLQRRKIVKALGQQIDIENLAFMKYVITSCYSIVWILISDIVTINRNTTVLHRCENNHCIPTIKLLSRSI